MLWHNAPVFSFLLQVVNTSFSQSLSWLCLLTQHPTRGEPSFRVTSPHIKFLSKDFLFFHKPFITFCFQFSLSLYFLFVCQIVCFPIRNNQLWDGITFFLLKKSSPYRIPFLSPPKYPIPIIIPGTFNHIY